MINLKEEHNINQNKILKNDLIEKFLFIIEEIRDYYSSLNQITSTIFDKKNCLKKEINSININTIHSLIDEKENFEEEEEPYTLEDYFYYWLEKLEFDDNLLILTMMNIDKILSKKFILNQNNVKNVLFTSMVITQKFYDDINFKDKDYSKILGINPNELIEMEIEFLLLIDFSLYISEEEFTKYKYKIENY